jgi:hypothetical protein
MTLLQALAHAAPEAADALAAGLRDREFRNAEMVLDLAAGFGATDRGIPGSGAQ